MHAISSSDINKDWTCKDKDQAYKDQDKDKDFTYSYLLQVATKPTIAIKQLTNNNEDQGRVSLNEHKGKIH